ncbi:unnamed protein product [Oncorhynchus mykiss]|uniref:Cadherin domain-containing protein n=1 Tax=Oncorhynchus mykiss TaxID=8022 RepID=A0A060XHS5_ONCMY|nr:unnamed protein product [Oncorhynchus mykiss]
MGDRGQRRRWEYWWVALRFSLLLCFGEKVSAQIRYSIPEEVKEGSVVGNVAKDLGLDVSTLAERRFRIVSGSKDALFQVNQNNGVLYVHKNMDREELCGGNGACLMDLKIVVENPLEIHYIGVEITDVNDHSPSFAEKDVHLQIAENTLMGARFELQTARDLDIESNAVRVYRLSQNDHFDLEVKDNGEEDKLLFLPLDREQNRTHELLLTAVDGGNPPKSGLLNITVIVLDTNDNRPVFNQDIYSVSLKENSPIGTIVTTVNASDADAGLNGAIEYSLGRAVKRKVYDIFQLDSITGEIKVKGEVDFEENEVYRLNVQASDKGQPPLTVDCRVIIKVVDVNDNKPEIDVTSLSNTIAEDSKPGTVISLVSVTDKDSGINGEGTQNDMASFLNINSDNGHISALKRFDFETLKAFQFQVVATDSGTPSLSTNVTVNVFILDQNDNAPVILYPVSTNGSAEGVEEIPRNVNAGHLVTKVRAYDADIGYNGWLLFSLQEVTDHSLFALDRYTGQIRTLRSFTETDEAEHKLVILVKDNGNVSLSATSTMGVLVEITDVNDHSPSFAERYLHLDIAENTLPGTRFELQTARDADVGLNSVRIYKLSSNDHFELELIDNGDEDKVPFLIIRKAIDREQNAMLWFILTAIDGGNPPRSGTINVTVTILDTNDNRPICGKDLYTVTIQENAPIGIPVLTINATDTDEGQNGEIEYALGRNIKRKVHDTFHLNSLTGEIRAIGPVDFEENEFYKLTVQASDKGQPPLSVDCRVVITITDVNDNKPEIGENVYSFVTKGRLNRELFSHYDVTITATDFGQPPLSTFKTLSVQISDVNDNSPEFSQTPLQLYLVENNVPGASIFSVNASDKDLNENAVISYHIRRFRIVSGSKDALFHVNQNNGVLYVHKNIDREQNTKHMLLLAALDGGNPPKSGTLNITVRVLDVNDNRPICTQDEYSVTLPENALNGTIVIRVNATDADDGQNGVVEYTLGRTLKRKIHEIFELDHVTGEIQVKGQVDFEENEGRLDRELVSHYDITITATDCGHPPLSTFKTLSVQISDVNDNSPEFSPKHIELYLAENNVPGASIFYVSASDKDLNENAAISYHIVREGTQIDMASFLNINSDNGDISALTSFDFETLKTFNFQVVATDSGTPSLSTNVTVNVFILDQNDNAPVILYPVSTNGSAEGVEEIPRNVNAGHLVTKVRAYDADIGYNGWLLFSLQEVTDHSLFALDRYTGQIRTLRSFTETDETEHKLVILVKDNGNVSLSATSTVIIKPKEAFAASDVKSSVKDEEENSVTFYLIITLGSVSTLFLISIIVLIVMQCSKATDYSSKYLQDVNYDGTLCHSIQYRSGDNRYMLVRPRMSIEVKTRGEDKIPFLILKKPLDREQMSEILLTLTAFDGGKPERSGSVNITVKVIDMNDNVPVYDRQSPYTFYVPENNAPGESLFSLSTSDRDQDDNARVSYHIWKGDGDTPIVSYLNINSDGNIYALKSFDFEATKTFQFQVVATDSGTPSLSSNVTVNVFILDQNDNAPVILYPVSTNGSAEGVEEIPRNVNAGHLVTKVRAYDADIGYNGWLLFSLQEVTDHSLFALDRYTGQIRTLRYRRD